MTDLNSKLESILSYYSPEEQERIQKAFEFAKTAHDGQDRANGDPYITHAVAVAELLAKIKLDAPTIIAALLHDVPEDTEFTLQDIEKKFGQEVAYLVSGVTKLTRVRLRGSNEPGYVENLRKMFIAAAQDLRVVLIKLADRLHNMRTISALPEDKQKSISRETLEIFAPLANRLGMGEIKGELEDLAFPYVYPNEYQNLVAQITSAYEERLQYIETAIAEIRKAFDKKNLAILDIHGRAKHLYSLYNKLLRYSTQNVEDITDLIAVRILVPTTTDCYAVMGSVHEQFKPLPGKIKDYISLPKPNGYQSLHTTVFGPQARVLEIQIRTPEMHQYAERGIAAHWAYTESGKPRDGFTVSKKFLWIKQLRDLQGSLAADPKEFLKVLKLDFFQDRIFCFTPQGDVIDLPAGATPVDFAFALHSDLGFRCQGAKINGRIVKLSEKLNNGDVVEILLNKNPVKISRDWLLTVKTSKAREHIRKALRS